MHLAGKPRITTNNIRRVSHSRVITEARLFSVRGLEFKRSHLLVIGILVIAVSLSMMIRFQGAEYGFELNEFDPYFNYRATEFLVANGLEEYYDWHDDMSWYPTGRDISATSQVMLHMTAAATYYLFGGGMDVLSYVIIFPAVVGSLTAVVVFALVRTIGGTGAGLFAALLFAVAPAIVVRGTMGWFKSEPLGLFYGLLSMYLLLSGIGSADRRIAGIKVASGGALLALGLGSWGGVQYFAIPLAVFFMALPFFRSDHRFLLWAVPLFGAVFLGTVMLFERPGPSFVLGLGGITVMASTAVMAAVIFVKSRSGGAWLRNCLLLLVGVFSATGIALFLNSLSNFLPLPSFRYVNAINPFLTTVNPLVDSISEHATSDTATTFWFLSILMIFAGIGAWLMLSGKLNARLRQKPEMAAFALILGITGVYVSSAFVRLEVLATISVVMLSALGLSIISGAFFHPENEDRKAKGRRRNTLQALFVVSMAMLLIIPVVAPADANWVTGVRAPPTILNGGTNLNAATSDWKDALDWMRENTPPDAVIASWWDYGYWITTLGERTTLADNFTTDDIRIAQIAKMMLSHPDTAWQMLQEMEADYVLIFISAQGVPSEPPTFLLGGGGDEQKNFWIINIAGEPVSAYLQPDMDTETPFFWENTAMGQMIPFSPRVYLNAETGEQSPEWRPGTIALVQKDVKLPAGGEGPLRLAYSSPSYDGNDAIIGVFIYEVNHDYEPSGGQPAETAMRQIDIASISTAQGDMTVLLDSEARPALVDGFIAQAESGAYDGTFFHRVVPDVLMQGGDPGASLRPDASPGLPAGAFADFGEAEYLLAAAAGSAMDAPDSQFFLLDADASWVVGSYTVFGSVVAGNDAADAIAALETDGEYRPLDMEQARILNVTISSVMTP